MSEKENFFNVKNITKFCLKGLAALTLLGGTYFLCRKKGHTKPIMQSQTYADVMVIPSVPERLENSVPSQIKYVSLLDQGPFGMIRLNNLFRASTWPSIATQATQNNTPTIEILAESTNLHQKMMRQIDEFGKKDTGKRARSDLLQYLASMTIPPEFKTSINLEVVQEDSTSIPTDSSIQTIASNTPVDIDALWEDGPVNQEPILQTPDGVERFEDKSERIYNNVKSIAILTEEWIDPIRLSSEENHNYAGEITESLKRVDPLVIEKVSLQASGDIAAGSSSQQTSLTSDSRSKSDMQRVVEQFNDQQKSEVVSGLARTIAHKTNKAILRSTIQKNPAIFNSAIPLTVENLIQKGLVDGNNPELDLTNPEILTEILEKCRKLEIANEINATEKQKQLGLEIIYTGEKNKNKFSVFGSNTNYNQTKTRVASSGKAIDKINSEISSSTNYYTQQKGVSSEKIVQQFIVDNKSQEEILQLLSQLETSIQDVKENPSQVIELAKEVIETRKPLPSLTFETEYESDYAIRKNTRIGLSQRMAFTDPSGDSGDCVLLPPAVHRIKEAEGQNFIEPANAKYKDGINSFLDVLQQNVFNTLDTCSDEDRRHIPVAKYKAAYQTAFDNKKQELKIRFPGCTPQDIYMIYHGRLAHLSNHTTLNSAYDKAIQNKVVFQTKEISDNGNKILLKNHSQGERVIKLQNETVNSLFVGVQQNTYFINSLRELVSPAAVQFIEVIQQQNRNTVSTYMSELKYSLGEVSDLQMESIRDSETLFGILHSQELTQIDPNTNEGKAEMLYHFSKNVLNLTRAGNRLYANDNVLPLRELLEGKAPIGQILYLREGVNSTIQSSGIADTLNSFGGFDSKAAHDLFNLLTGQDNLLTEADPKMSELTARRIIKEKNFQNLDELKTYIDNTLKPDGSLDLKGIGRNKTLQLENVVDTAMRRRDEARGASR